MPQPTSSDVYVDVPLTDISVAYIQAADSFVADQVFPMIPVERQGGLYLSYDRSYWFRDSAKERALATESAGDGYTVDFQNPYFCRVYALHKDIDDQTRANAMPPMNLDRDTTEWLTQQLMIRKELQWASSFFGPGIWTGNLSGIATGTPTPNSTFLQWNQSGSTPIEDITGQIIAMAALTGYRPNKLVLTPDVYNVLLNHAEFLDRIKYTQRGVMTAELMATVLGLDSVLVAWAVTNTGTEGGTAAYNFAMSNGALLLYAAPGPGILRPSAGYTFSWAGYTGAGPAGNRILSFRMDQLRSDRIEGEIAFAQQVVAADLGTFFTDCI